MAPAFFTNPPETRVSISLAPSLTSIRPREKALVPSTR